MDEQRTANSSIDDSSASFPSIMSKIPSRAWLITIAETSLGAGEEPGASWSGYVHVISGWAE